MLAFIIDKSRWFIRSRGHGCTDMALVAARTYGWDALTISLNFLEGCWQEHPAR